MSLPGIINLDYTWEVSREWHGALLTITHEGGTTRPLPSWLEKYGDDPLPHGFVLPDNANDEAVITTITAMREAVIAASRKRHRREPWPDVPKPSLPHGVAPYDVYWGKIAAALSPDEVARLEASGVVRRIPAPKIPPGHPDGYVLEINQTHLANETGRFLTIFAQYAGQEARAQLCAWMDWGGQWEGWVEELAEHTKPTPGGVSVFDVDW